LGLLKEIAQQVSAALARFPSLAHSVASEEISGTEPVEAAGKTKKTGRLSAEVEHGSSREPAS
jgi:hypothetical protein